MTTMQRYAAAAGLVLAIACGDSGVERAAAQAAPGRPPPAPVDPCALLTQAEAAAILGKPAAAPTRHWRGPTRGSASRHASPGRSRPPVPISWMRSSTGPTSAPMRRAAR